jgi:hypothetical protein
MRCLVFGPLIAAATVATTLLAGAAPRSHYLLTDQEGFVLGDAELVAAPPVTSAVWSPDGRYLLAVRQEKLLAPGPEPLPSGALSLIAWNRGTGRSRVIWQRAAGPQTISQVEWLPATRSALIVLNWLAPAPEQPEPRKTLLWIDAAHGQSRVVAELRSEQLLISRTQPRAALYNEAPYSREAPFLRVVGVDGTLGPAVPLPKNFSVGEWAPDGSVLYGVVWEGPGTREQPAHAKRYAFDLRTGALSPLAPAPETPPERAMPVRLRQTSMVLKEENTSQSVSPLWLESAVKSERPRVLVCADGEGGSVAPDAWAVLYLSQGAAWVAPLTRMPREQMLAQVRAAQRAAAMSNGKQIALAFSMYAQDYDETFPPADGRAMDVLRPYVRNDEVFNSPDTGAPGLTYVYTGGPVNTIDNPATAVLGYFAGPGGRVVIYVDGHVKWQDDTRSPGATAGEARRRCYFR